MKLLTDQAADSADVDAAVAAAKAAFEPGSEWRSMVSGDRRDLMWKLAQLMEQHRGDLAYYEAMAWPINSDMICTHG